MRTPGSASRDTTVNLLVTNECMEVGTRHPTTGAHASRAYRVAKGSRQEDCDFCHHACGGHVQGSRPAPAFKATQTKGCSNSVIVRQFCAAAVRDRVTTDQRTRGEEVDKEGQRFKTSAGFPARSSYDTITTTCRCNFGNSNIKQTRDFSHRQREMLLQLLKISEKLGNGSDIKTQSSSTTLGRC